MLRDTIPCVPVRMGTVSRLPINFSPFDTMVPGVGVQMTREVTGMGNRS